MVYIVEVYTVYICVDYIYVAVGFLIVVVVMEVRVILDNVQGDRGVSSFEFTGVVC